MHGCGVQIKKDRDGSFCALVSINECSLCSLLSMSGTTHTQCEELTSVALEQQAGKFFTDDFVGPVMSCSSESAKEAATEADVAAAMARYEEGTFGRRE